jgi:hypothetical protein
MTYQDVIRDLDRSLSARRGPPVIMAPPIRASMTYQDLKWGLDRSVQSVLRQLCLVRSGPRWCYYEDQILRSQWRILKTWYWDLDDISRPDIDTSNERTVRGVHRVWIVRSGSGWTINNDLMLGGPRWGIKTWSLDLDEESGPNIDTSNGTVRRIH